MALQSVKGSKNVPANAFVVSKEDALDYQKTIIKNWGKESDVVFLKYGRHIASGITAISSILVCGFYRKIFRLKFILPFTAMYLPVSGISMIATNYSFEKRITENTLLSTMKCPMCSQIRYICGHVISSVFYPGVTSLMLFSIIGRTKQTVDAPLFSTHPKEFCKYAYNVTKPSALKFQGLLAFHLFSILFLQHMQVVELNNLNKKITEIENSSYNELEMC